MKILVLFLALFISISLFAQGNPKSLIADYKSDLQTDNDTLRFKAYIGIATQFNFVDGEQDSVLYFAEKALEIADRLEILQWKNTATYYQGLYHLNYSQDFEKAIYFYEITKEGLIEDGDFRRLSTVYNAIGGCKSSLGDFEGAMVDYMEVYKIAEESMDYTTLSNTLSNTSLLYTHMGEDLKAIETLKQSLEFNKRDTTGDKGYSYLNASLNLLDIYVQIDSLNEAELLISEIQPVADSMRYSIALDRLLQQKIYVLKKTNQLDELDRVTEEAYLAINNSQTHNQNFQSLAYEYALNQLRKGNQPAVLKVIQEIEEQTDQTSVLFQLRKFKSLADLNKKVGKYEDALHYTERYQIIQDSINTIEKASKLEELLKKYELAQKETLIQKAKLEKLRLEKKNSLLLAILMGLLGLASLLYLWYQQRRKKEQEKIHQLEQKMLSLQMNPHFIFNAISSIQNFLYDAGDTKQAVHHLSTFASLMRQILENSREKFIPLEEEIQFLTNYLNLQKLRFDDKFDFEINIAPDIDIEHISIPPLLTQPFIENAIEHGRIHDIVGGKLILQISKGENNVSIDIIDNGIGLEGSAVKENVQKIGKSSLSIAITRERLELLSKMMKNKFSLQIKPNSTSSGTHVHLNIPSIYL